MPPGTMRTAVAPSKPQSAAERVSSRLPSATPMRSTPPPAAPSAASWRTQAIAPDSSVPIAATAPRSAGRLTSDPMREPRSSGNATLSRNRPTSRTATIVPMPPSVITDRAIASPARTQGLVRRRRDRPVKVGVESMHRIPQGGGRAVFRGRRCRP